MSSILEDQPGSQGFPTALLKPLYPSKGDFIAVVGRLGDVGLVRRMKAAMRGGAPLAVRSINALRAIPGVDFSDHASYWDRGFPAVMITDTAFYRNAAYHTAADTPDRLEYRRAAQVAQGVYQAVLALCGPAA